MIVSDLNGKDSVWKISASPKSKRRCKKSSYHTEAFKLLNKLYPIYPVCEEVPIHVEEGVCLYIDIYLPTINMAIEIHGEQHYKFNSFFHKTKLDFIQQRRNDRLKSEWCDLNGIALVCLPFDEAVCQWKDRIENYEY